MELHAQRRADAERLHLGVLGPRQQLGTGGKPHHVVVQHVDLLVPHREVIVLVNALDRREPDFRRLATAEFATQRGGDDLMAEAHAQHRLADADGRLDQFRLDLETGILVIIQRAHRTAHNHQSGDLREVRQIGLLFLGDVHHRGRHVQVVQVVQDAPRLLPRDVLHDKHLRLRHNSIVASPT